MGQAVRERSVEDPEPVVESYVREAFPDVVAALQDAVAGATTNWPPDGITDPDRVRADLQTAVQSSGVRERLPQVLSAVVDELGASMRASPVAAPPYVVVTSEGVLLRATIDDTRLVIQFQVVERTAGRYQPLGDVEISARRT